ncbi:V-type ATP synthase subunit E [[Clostridium] leptum]|nr:V-type ATP synthase subunit E [[Clostridium] leptum]
MDIQQQDEKLSKFIEAINKDAEDRRSRILAEVEEYNKAEMKKAETEALTEAYHMIQEQIAQMRTSIRRELSQKEISLHRETLMQRENITKRVFEEAKKRLTAFTQSADYETFLVKAASNAKSVFPKGDIILSMRPSDMKFANMVAKVFEGRATVQEDESILLGGMRIRCQELGLVIDDTLDTRLNDQKAWFAQHSGLAVTAET